MDLTDAQLAELRQALENLQQELVAEIHETSDQSKPVSLDESIGRLSRIDAIQMQKMAEDQKRRRELRLKQVDSALKRMQDGSYGECVKCEEPISYKRLKIRPESPLCMNCQNKSER